MFNLNADSLQPKRHSNRRGVWRVLLCCGFALLLLSAGPSHADDDAEQARDLRAAGAILSLEHFVADARARHPGRVIDAELEYEPSHGRYVYEILILDHRGLVWELEYDAHSGVLIEKEPGG